MLGTLGAVSSPLSATSPISYLALGLNAGESWRLSAASRSQHLLVALGSGSLAVPESVQANELACFEPSNETIDFHAEADTEFVVGWPPAIRTNSRSELFGAH